MSEFLSPAEVAQKLGISKATVYKKIHDGEWECTKISDRIYRFEQHQFNAIVSKNASQSRRSNQKRLRDALKKIG